MGRYWAKIAQISDCAGKLQLGFIVRFLRDEGVAVRGCGTIFCRVVVPQRVTLPSLKFEQAVISQTAPPPPRGRGTGRGQMRQRLLLERICAQYGRCFASFVSSTASDRKGFVKGESVPLDPLLPPFGGAKGGPRRAGVQVMPLQKAPRRRQAITDLV